ncbi:hypothetical protein [Ascidiimonas aurantiaca]|uniref:hypothetical protein n=1 Tax=Ascidiimonas aurantiaca TaxID=1685432 RepID=UPI0030EC92AC
MPGITTSILIMGLLCFLTGFLLALFISRHYFKKLLKAKYILKDAMQNPPTQEADHTSSIKAVQTMGRSGTSVLETDGSMFKGVKAQNKNAKPSLNFSVIGLSSESEKDDLKKINGIGPFIEERLNVIGIYTFKQISRFTDTEIETVTRLIEFFPGRIKRDQWKEQAIALLATKEQGAK